jgi:hypothetical protein
MSVMGMFRQPSPAQGLLPLPHVQFRKAENTWRLDRSHSRGHPRDTAYLVDATDVRTVNALKTPPARSKSAMGMLRQLLINPVLTRKTRKLGWASRECLH